MITSLTLLLWSLLNATVYVYLLKKKFIDLIIVGDSDSFRDYLDLFDFVYIDNADEYLIELFNDVTDEYFLTNRLYRVVKLENDIDLVLIDHVNTMESTRMLNVR